VTGFPLSKKIVEQGEEHADDAFLLLGRETPPLGVIGQRNDPDQPLPDQVGPVAEAGLQSALPPGEARPAVTKRVLVVSHEKSFQIR
jgi:hypothetical protein